MGNGKQFDIRAVKAVCHLVAGYAYLFDKSHLVCVNRGKAVKQIDFFPVRCGVTKHTKRRKGRNRIFCLLGIVHALRLVDDDDGVGGLYVSDSCVTVQPVMLLVYDIFSLSESVNIDNHNLDICAVRKLPYIGQLCAVIDEITAGSIIIECGKMLLCALQRFIYALADRHAGNDDDKLGKTMQTVQFINGFRINVCLARPCFHFNGKLPPLQIPCLGQPVFPLYRLHIFNHSLIIYRKGVR